MRRRPRRKQQLSRSIMNFVTELRDFQTLGCEDQTKCAAACRVYIHLKEINRIRKVDKIYDPEFDLIYLSCMRKRIPTIYVPALSCQKLDLIMMGKIQAKLAPNDTKSIALALCDTSSTILFYRMNTGFGPLNKNKRLQKEIVEQEPKQKFANVPDISNTQKPTTLETGPDDSDDDDDKPCTSREMLRRMALRAAKSVTKVQAGLQSEESSERLRSMALSVSKVQAVLQSEESSEMLRKMALSIAQTVSKAKADLKSAESFEMLRKMSLDASQSVSEVEADFQTEKSSEMLSQISLDAAQSVSKVEADLQAEKSSDHKPELEKSQADS